MSNAIEERLGRELAALEAKQRKRDLRISECIDFTSNDYLGMTKNLAVRERAIRDLQSGMPLGSGGSRLLRGNHIWHEHAEKDFADSKILRVPCFFPPAIQPIWQCSLLFRRGMM